MQKLVNRPRGIRDGRKSTQGLSVGTDPYSVESLALVESLWPLRYGLRNLKRKWAIGILAYEETKPPVRSISINDPDVWIDEEGTRADAPDEVNAPVQCGPRVSALAA